ncbi:hypothetical protein EV356DRAFT_526864 [Viridothelium virens]|uniref:Zn(2)-C6 fungal-type domain-containing protein n=1 Tax=Viridothelium virens TaxID=1048519 RepID=A0A6A6GX84_VIRVR|nr:hypothetical protein EV356DRAFT_526864 [Viridothelium virens]
MEQSTTTAPPLSIENTPQSDVDEILRRKRKAREHKACYPCRQRKVKCTQEVPCKTCIDREHPELCTYHPPDKRRKTGSIGSGNNSVDAQSASSLVTLPRTDWERLCSKLETVEQSLSELRSDIRSVAGDPVSNSEREDKTPPPAENRSEKGNEDPLARHVTSQGIHAHNDLTGGVTHLGGSSVPALVMALGRGPDGRPGVQELMGRSILPMFGLDNESATYPFVDLWGGPQGTLSRANELCKTIPSDVDCLEFFRYYRDTAHIVYSGLVDIDQFESEIAAFLTARANAKSEQGVTEETIYGQSIHWVGLLFAVLASGCQCSSMPRKERELTSQVFVCCSFECLRLINYFAHSNLDDIQNLLVLGNVISNNFNAGVAWSLMGLVIRLSQSLGLHRSCPPNTPKQKSIKRTKIWWAVIWQDSLLSITYDRASTTSTISHHKPVPQDGVLSYVDCMYCVSTVGLDIVRERASPDQSTRHQMQRITMHKEKLERMMDQAADHLRDSRKCQTFQQQLQHWALYLHVSYILSELCRPAISPGGYHRHELTIAFRETCIESLANTVEAFLGLQNITPFANRSWSSVHRALSSALLLGILGEPARHERARRLLGRLISIMEGVTSHIDPTELSAPISRSINALRKLNVQESITPRMAANGGDGPTPTTNGSVSSVSGDFKPEDVSFIMPSPLMTLDEDNSPYSLMDSILWGASRSSPHALGM